jgi:hypothetical protein
LFEIEKNNVERENMFLVCRRVEGRQGSGISILECLSHIQGRIGEKSFDRLQQKAGEERDVGRDVEVW